MLKCEQTLIRDLTDTCNLQALVDWRDYLEEIESPRHRLLERITQAIDVLTRAKEEQHA